MTYEQLTLDLPSPDSHGVVIDQGPVTERFGLSDRESAVRVAEAIRKARTWTVWDYAPKPSGWYGLAPGGVVCRIAAY